MVDYVTLTRKAAAEATGTAFFLATVIGSGIMGEKLSIGATYPGHSNKTRADFDSVYGKAR
jgi:hypothetical protein